MDWLRYFDLSGDRSNKTYKSLLREVTSLTCKYNYCCSPFAYSLTGKGVRHS
ncbi:hypothetical protein APA_1721 [Pseudanabaena sp. lw0831]|nr:hypothetical protein APA_1721 [Pseudanabaena sp. lw0831]